MVKRALILVGVILVCSLIAAAVGRFNPVEKTREITLANYSHRAEFNYTAYSTSGLFSGQSAQPAPALFPKIIEDLEILFAYSGPETGAVRMKVILEDASGNWQKEIPVETTGGSIISFPLDLDEILGLGNTISTELGGRGYGYLLRIVAEVGTGSVPFKAVLEGELDSSTLKWREAGFNKIERGFPGGDDWRQAAFGYKVKLKENELFGPISLQKNPELQKVFAVDPSFALFTPLVESLDIGFNYQFNCDARINSLTQEVTVEMVVAEPGRWSKSFTLVPPTKKQGAFTINLPLDIGKLAEMAESIDKWLPSQGVTEQQITILAQVHTIAETNSGTIDEVFNHQLKGKIGGLIEWEVGTEEGEGLTLVKTGKITKAITEPNLFMQRLRTYSLIGLVASLLIFCGLAVLYWWRRTKLPFLEKELERNRKKYGELISEVSDFPPIREGEVIIHASSLEALVNISSNSLKPILLKVEPDKHTYWVADGLVRYEYVSKLGLPAKEERTEDEPGRRMVDDQR